MPRGRVIVRVKRSEEIRCRSCRKTLSKKEAELHVFICDKVPQEIFNGSSLKVTSEEKD